MGFEARMSTLITPLGGHSRQECKNVGRYATKWSGPVLHLFHSDHVPPHFHGNNVSWVADAKKQWSLGHSLLRIIMRYSLVTFAALWFCAVAVVLTKAQTNKYTNKYDNVNVDRILSNQRILNNYIKCLMEEGPCTSEGKELRSKWYLDLLFWNIVSGTIQLVSTSSTQFGLKHKKWTFTWHCNFVTILLKL